MENVHVTPFDRPFRVIAFDWDGTAVPDRAADASAARGAIELLLGQGVVIAVITGTSFENVDRQLTRDMAEKRNLYVATNRGSEVFGFDEQERPIALFRRVATEAEERLLTQVADAVKAALAERTGLSIDVVYDRMNRRKIDLLPEWRDPPKADIAALNEAVEGRLEGAGLEGGLRAALDLAARISSEHGLTGARITSDVKHIEIGLTDKGDAVEWLFTNVVESRGIRPDEVLIAGDELGDLGGTEGSDRRMLIVPARGAVFVSVGAEPLGVPPGVVHLGGGPARFVELLLAQAALRAARTVSLPARWTDDPRWLVAFDGFTLAIEHEVESLLTVANGAIGTRGSLPERCTLSAPATILAGVFEVPPNALTPNLVRLPDWTHLEPAVDGHPVALRQDGRCEHRRVLDLRQGILFRLWRARVDSTPGLRVEALRLASLADRHTLLQSVVVAPEAAGAPIRLESRIARGPFSRALPAPDGWLAEVQTAGDGALAGMAGADLRTGPVEEVTHLENGDLVQRWNVTAEPGRAARLDRIVCVGTSREGPNPSASAIERLRRRLDDGVEKLVTDHVEAWAARWRDTDVELDGDVELQRALRFAGYHLISAANPEDERASVGARGLTGAIYRGHVFWDTEIFMLPFYALTWPEAARALLMYRWHTLPAARSRAAAIGCAGALFAWESAATGEDATPPLLVTPGGDIVRVLTGEQEQHISADVAYAVWLYWKASGDDAFFRRAGAELVIETARFWATRGRLEPDGRCHIRRVIGPDEYHEGVDDNAYTNLMARWNLERGADAASWLRAAAPRRFEELGVGESEPERWLELARAMAVTVDPATQVVEQFAGWFKLADVDLAPFGRRPLLADVLLGRERVQASQVVKQPDVLMALQLLWDGFSPEAREANFRYYERRTSHGSSLSPPVHAQLAARLGDLDLAEHFFRQTAEIDLSNRMGNAAGGVHAASLGGLWQAAVLGFGGLSVGDGGLRIDPHVPKRWRRLTFRVRWHGQRLVVAIDPDGPAVAVEVDGDRAVPVAIGGSPAAELQPAKRWTATQSQGEWSPWREAAS